MVNGVDFVDDTDTEKTHLQGSVHFVHNVHPVHCLDIKLPNLDGGAGLGPPLETEAQAKAAYRAAGEAYAAVPKPENISLRSDPSDQAQSGQRPKEHAGGIGAFG